MPVWHISDQLGKVGHHHSRFATGWPRTGHQPETNSPFDGVAKYCTLTLSLLLEREQQRGVLRLWKIFNE
jgi:hypothetical protein